MKQLQRHREKSGMLPEDLAAKSGVHIRTIKELEGYEKKRKVQSRVQRGIAKALGLKPIDLFDSRGFTR